MTLFEVITRTTLGGLAPDTPAAATFVTAGSHSPDVKRCTRWGRAIARPLGVTGYNVAFHVVLSTERPVAQLANEPFDAIGFVSLHMGPQIGLACER